MRQIVEPLNFKSLILKNSKLQLKKQIAGDEKLNIKQPTKLVVHVTCTWSGKLKLLLALACAYKKLRKEIPFKF